MWRVKGCTRWDLSRVIGVGLGGKGDQGGGGGKGSEGGGGGEGGSTSQG